MTTYLQTPPTQHSMKLDEDSMKNFQVAKSFSRDKRINFLDFRWEEVEIIK